MQPGVCVAKILQTNWQSLRINNKMKIVVSGLTLLGGGGGGGGGG